MEYLIAMRFLVYLLGGLLLCYTLRSMLKGFTVSGTDSDERSSAHFSIMTTAVLPILSMVFQKLDTNFVAANVWGFVALICHIYMAIHLHHKEILLPIFRSRIASLLLRVGIAIEMIIFREGFGCFVIALLITLGCVLYTIGVISGLSRLYLILVFILYLSLRNIASRDGLICRQALDPSKEFFSQIRSMNEDMRPYLSLLPMLCLFNIVIICIIGSVEQAPTVGGLFKTGCYKLQSLFKDILDTNL